MTGVVANVQIAVYAALAAASPAIAGGRIFDAPPQAAADDDGDQ